MNNFWAVIVLFFTLIPARFLSFAESGWLVRRAIRPAICTFPLPDGPRVANVSPVDVGIDGVNLLSDKEKW